MNSPTRSEVEGLRREKNRYLAAQQQKEQKLDEAEERFRKKREPPRTSKADNKTSSTHRERAYWRIDVAREIFSKKISGKEEQRAYIN